MPTSCALGRDRKRSAVSGGSAFRLRVSEADLKATYHPVLKTTISGIVEVNNPGGTDAFFKERR